MSREELIYYLKYLINKYVPSKKREVFSIRLLKADVPVKDILADFNELSEDYLEEEDGELIRDIYFHFC